ncbi:MAG: hypothetical protein ACT6XY_04130 [Phreatobacter sp.]|uniref:hypothetical protein n=1 Tax=Phreatobacter sp. TaxID=1966341 RepID=UPI0040374838
MHEGKDEVLIMDNRDRLILALAAQLRAERETRQAFAEAVRSGLQREVMVAMLEDPIPAITQLDLLAADAVAAAAPAYHRAA